MGLDPGPGAVVIGDIALELRVHERVQDLPEARPGLELWLDPRRRGELGTDGEEIQHAREFEPGVAALPDGELHGDGGGGEEELGRGAGVVSMIRNSES